MNDEREAEPMKIDSYLERMAESSQVVSEVVAAGVLPLAGKSVLLIHHLTGEVLGVIAALRRLGCRDIVTVFVGYNADAAKVYRPDLEDLPSEEFRCYILGTDPDSPKGSGPVYVIPNSFVKQPTSEDASFIGILNATMKEKTLIFVAAMRALIAYVGLAQIARTRARGEQVVIIEDGGYAAPIFNEAALTSLSVTDFRSQHLAPPDPTSDASLPSAMKECFTESVFGSVEHTRNGYDQNMRVYLKHGQLAVPAFSIAVSFLKTQVEADTVAATILNAIESVLYSFGLALGPRNVFLFGSRGNVGRRLAFQLRGRLAVPDDALIGCDLKVSRADVKTVLPPWQPRPSQSSIDGASEVTTFEEVDSPRKRKLDLIVGVTGGPTQGHPVLQVPDVVAWLRHGYRPELWLVSGSTKTAEFPEILAWVNSLLASAMPDRPVVEVELDGQRWRVEKRELIDALSRRLFGSRYVFTVADTEGAGHRRDLVFVSSLTPANFLFYGVPTEVIDQVLAQLISTSVALLRQRTALTEARLYAVDYDSEASAGVYGSKPPADGVRIPLPEPA
jgi:hypothetical protein